MTASTIAIPRARRPRGSGRLPWGSPAIYFGAVVVVTLMLAPILYIIIGGFRTNSQITADPSGLPAPWVMANYAEVLGSTTFWGEVGNVACSTRSSRRASCSR
jgi:raffinose/stachyose/melibiose transport system permease protein